MSRARIVRLATAAIGLALVAVTLWIAIALPATVCGHDGDGAFCYGRGPWKILIGAVGAIVGILVLFVAAKMEE